MTTHELDAEADRIKAMLTADEFEQSRLRFDQIALLLQRLSQIQALQAEHLPPVITSAQVCDHR